MRRMFWLGVGAAAGASGTVWAQRRVRGAIEDLGAEQVVAMAGRGARAAARTLVAAVGEGRAGMTQRENELRARMHGTESVLDVRRNGSAATRGSSGTGALRAVPYRRSGR